MRIVLSRTLPFLFAAGLTLASGTQQPLHAQPASTPVAPQTSENLPTLADVLTTDRRLSIWYSYARDSSEITRRLSSTNAASTLLVPLNSAIIALPRKPHQAAATEPRIESFRDQDLASNKRVEAWLASHVVPSLIDFTPSPTPGTQLSAPTLLNGFSIHVEAVPSACAVGWIVGEGKGKVLDVLEASNGRVLVIDQVVVVPEEQD